MAEHDQDQRTEQATDKQKKEFRDRGDVAKSADVAAVVALAASFCSLVVAWPMISQSILRLGHGTFGRLEIHSEWYTLAIPVGKTLMSMVLPVAATVSVFAIATQIAQSGWHPTVKPLIPDFTKLNPLPRLRQLFISGSTLIELVKSLVKVIVVGYLSIDVLVDAFSKHGRLAGLAPVALFHRLGDIATSIVIRVGLALAFVAVADLLLERYRHGRKMMMTKQQVKQEGKDQDGDPMVKRRMRGRAHELARGRMLEDVADANVVVVNPTHYSVAIRYRMAEDAAPVIVASGVDKMAAQIRERARHLNIPVVSNPPLARALYSRGTVGGYIPADLYQAVASLLAWVYSLSGRVA